MLEFPHRVSIVLVFLLGLCIPRLIWLLLPSSSSLDQGLLTRVSVSPSGPPVLAPGLDFLRSKMGSSASQEVVSQKSVHDFSVQDASGNTVDLSTYKGKVLLIVNVASQCGFTQSNYKGLTEIHNKYRDQGFEILAFPCNQFGGQEPGTNEQIKEFACTKFNADFPIFDKVNVNGADTAPLYTFLKAKKGGGILGESIKWNFSKFLVDKEGNVVERYAPTTNPTKIEKDIKKLL